MWRPLVIATFFSGCYNPDDIIPIRGSAPQGQRIELARAPFCFREMTTFVETNAADDGAFTFEVFRAQAQNLRGLGSYCLRARTQFPSGTYAQADVPSLQTAVRLPPFVDWQPGLTFDGGAFQFDGVDAGSEFFVHHLAQMTAADGGVLWRQSELTFGLDGIPRVPLNIDERVLREFPGVVALEATYAEARTYSLLPDPMARPAVTLRARDEVTFTNSNAPPSRGMPCDELPLPCPLTDGRVEGASVPRSTSTLTLRFVTPVTPSLVVVRQAALVGESFEVELPDGGRIMPMSLRVMGLTASDEEVELARRPFWPLDAAQDLTPLADGGFPLPSSYFAIPLDAGVPFTGIRLRASSFQRVSEVSVF